MLNAITIRWNDGGAATNTVADTDTREGRMQLAAAWSIAALDYPGAPTVHVHPDVKFDPWSGMQLACLDCGDTLRIEDPCSCAIGDHGGLRLGHDWIDLFA